MVMVRLTLEEVQALVELLGDQHDETLEAVYARLIEAEGPRIAEGGGCVVEK
jgi:hypothetical protein